MILRWFAAFACAILLVSAGCAGTDRPDWSHPGNASQQQARAEHYDPYPTTETGPAIVGGRPMGYEKPPAEVLRVQQPKKDPLAARWLPWNW